ncbi:MAG TPA: AtpZ/AtpI family protein [Xanthobacteraceae bacterium]|jgi:ATP synthase protein I|nr:AtpZ/AtpI family protein [Xanthobacteraceae bacterium]
MTGNAHDGDPEGRSTDEADLSARLRRLGERLDRERSSRSSESAPSARSTTDTSAFVRGLRLSSELVAGVLVGCVIGWLLDHWLGISPWGLIVFLMLGFAAGVLNVMRAAGAASGNQPGGDNR